MSISDPNKNDIHLEEIKVPLIVEQRSVEKPRRTAYLHDELPDVELPLHSSSEQEAGWLNKLLFCFVAQYLWRTRDSKNDNELLEKPLERFRAKEASLVLARVWEAEQARGGSFLNAIIKTVGSKVAAHGILLFLEEAIHLVQPLCMGRLMGFFRPGSMMSYEDAYYAAAGVAITALISPVIHHPYFHGLLKLGCELKVGTSTLLYQKGLKLSSSSVQHTSTGQLINLLSTDVVKFDMSFIFIHYVWLCPILLFAYGYVIWRELGAACIAGFVCLFFLIFTQGFFSSFMGINRRHIAERADKRLSVMNEIISGIRVIKMYAWEDAFASIVKNYRELEIQKVKLSSIFSAIVMGVFFTSGKIALLCALLVYIYLGHDITAERIFVASALYNSCRLPFSLFLPLGIHLLTELRTTATRVETFLNLKEFSRVTKTTPRGNKRKNKKKVHQALIEHPIDNKGQWMIDLAQTKNPKIEITNLYTLWMDDNEHKAPKKKWWKRKSDNEDVIIETQPCYGVQNVTFHARGGECIAVVGQVGSGKSSFLSSILGEAKIMSGSLHVSGRIAYCSQEPWIFSGTVRDNILFGCDYDKEKYARTVEICLLVQDFKQLANGDMSEVGDKGSTLSGGQRARVALARAVYSEADIYLLDDPLSAVDANVGKLLYKKLITEFLKEKLVILVTHQIQYLEDLPNVLLMKDSAIVGRGSIGDLKRDFKDLFVALGEDTNQEQDEKTVTRSVSRSSAKRTFSTTSDRRTSFSECASPNDFVDTVTSLIEEEDEEEATNGKNVNGNEERSSGSVPMSVYWAYIKEVCHPTFQGILLGIFVVVTQIMFNFVDWWMNKWATSAEKWDAARGNSTFSGPFYDNYNLFGHQFEVDADYYKWSFAILTIVLSVCGIFRCIWFRLAQIGASRRLHSKMFTAVVNTDVAFFDANSVGRVLNRFSKDMSQVDDNIAFVFFEFIMGMLSFIGTVLVIVVLSPMVFIATIPMIIAFYFVRQIYINRSRDLKRIEATSRSPMNTHISATLAGLPTIRAYGKEREMIGKFFATHDINLAAFNMSLVTARWFAVCIDILVACFITAVAFICVWQYSLLSSGEVALMLVYAVQLTGFFSWIMRQSAELQNGMVSVERIVEYTKLKSEYELRNLESHDFEDKKLGNSWPSDGRIKFEKVNVSYGGENVLSNLDFEIEPRQKIGIAGRTGAGKSTLLRVLFGLKDINSGKIIIDNVDCINLSLQYRRKGMAIIPQEPVLFIGTVRRNLDPFDEFNDDVLWDSLDQCELKEVVTEMGGLSAPMQEGGANFSVGQRQLVCLARALIHHAKILVIDEATANVDARTDAIIQKTLRIRFSNSTVLTIAHRLNTIMESDKIMVFENGHLVEFDTPKALMDNSHSALWNLVAQAGSENAQQLRKIANESHKNKNRNEQQSSSK